MAQYVPIQRGLHSTRWNGIVKGKPVARERLLTSDSAKELWYENLKISFVLKINGFYGQMLDAGSIMKTACEHFYRNWARSIPKYETAVDQPAKPMLARNFPLPAVPQSETICIDSPNSIFLTWVPFQEVLKDGKEK